MSELQLGLLVIGAVVVVAVLAYNKWQEIRYRRVSERAFGPGHDDVLMGAGSAREEGTGPAPAPVESPAPTLSGADRERIEPTLVVVQPDADAAALESKPEAHDDAARQPASPPPAAELNENLDHIIELECSSEIQGAKAIPRAAVLLQNFSQPVYLDIFDEGYAVWTPLTHERCGSRLRAGLQLVNRRGAATVDDIARFDQAVALLAQELEAGIEPSTQPAQAIARELDRFCGEVDLQIAISVVSSGTPFAGPALREFALSRGFSLDDDGRFHCRDEQGRELCTIQNAGSAAFVPGSLDRLSTTAVTVELDVPRAPGNIQAFDDCVAIARQLAAALGGRLADDNGTPLTEAGLAVIRAQLEPIYAAMTAKGIPAGSPQALRLFS